MEGVESRLGVFFIDKHNLLGEGRREEGGVDGVEKEEGQEEEEERTFETLVKGIRSVKVLLKSCMRRSVSRFVETPTREEPRRGPLSNVEAQVEEVEEKDEGEEIVRGRGRRRGRRGMEWSEGADGGDSSLHLTKS